MTESKKYQFQATVALITVQVLFGINYVVSKVIVANFPPLLWAAFRVVIASLALFGMAIVLKRKPPKVTKKFLINLCIFAALGVVINQASFLVGLKYTTATNSAILNTLIPIFTLLFVTISGREKMTLHQIVGFSLAFTGVLIIRRIEDFHWGNDTFKGDMLTILNCISYGLFLTVSKKFIEKHDSLWITACLFAVGSVGLTAISIPTWASFHWPALDAGMVGCMLFSILGATLLAYLLNNWALAHAKSSSVALFIYLQPVVASLLALCWFGEMISLRTALSSVLIFLGMLISIRR